MPPHAGAGVGAELQIFSNVRARVDWAVALEDELGAISVALRSVKEELELLRPLATKGDVSQAEVIRLERQRSELEGRYRNTENKFYRDAAAELERVVSDIAGLEQQLNQHQLLKKNKEYQKIVKSKC